MNSTVTETQPDFPVFACVQMVINIIVVYLTMYQFWLMR